MPDTRFRTIAGTVTMVAVTVSGAISGHGLSRAARKAPHPSIVCRNETACKSIMQREPLQRVCQLRGGRMEPGLGPIPGSLV